MAFRRAAASGLEGAPLPPALLLSSCWVAATLMLLGRHGMHACVVPHQHFWFHSVPPYQIANMPEAPNSSIVVRLVQVGAPKAARQQVRGAA